MKLVKVLLVLAALWGLILLLGPQLSWPATTAAKIECPDAPTGCLSPCVLMDLDTWELTTYVRAKNGMIWAFMNNKQPGSAASHAILILVPGVECPVLYNYVENGVIKFFEYNGTNYYEAKVSDELYNNLVDVYKQYANLDLMKRETRGVKNAPSHYRTYWSRDFSRHRDREVVDATETDRGAGQS